MSLIESVIDSVFTNEELKIHPFRYTVFSNKGVSFEGVKTVDELNEQKVVLTFKRCKVTIEGKNLKVKKYYENEMTIEGTIEKLYQEII